jgi:uncharacterized protein
MKLVIISDTHGNYPLAVQALELLDRRDHIIHLGDTTTDAKMIEIAVGQELIKLSGNCDISKKYPELIITSIAGKKFLLAHGHQFMVKNGLNLIRQRAIKEGVDVVLYGHTHLAGILNVDGTLFINPGALCKNASLQSLAVISIENDVISAETIAIRSMLCCAENSYSLTPHAV